MFGLTILCGFAVFGVPFLIVVELFVLVFLWVYPAGFGCYPSSAVFCDCSLYFLPQLVAFSLVGFSFSVCGSEVACTARSAPRFAGFAMLASPSCRDCMAPLQPDDGHDLCPSCLGIDHLREGLTDNACLDCGIMPLSLRNARLAALDDSTAWSPEQVSAPLPAAQTTSGKRTVAGDGSSATRKRSASAGAASSVPKKRSKDGRSSGLALKVDNLTSELAQMKSLIQALHGAGGGREGFGPQASDVASACDEEDAISVAASDSQFRESDSLFLGPLPTSPASEQGSRASTSSVTEGDNAAIAALRTALARLQLDTPPAQPSAPSAFFRRLSSTSSFIVPPSAEYISQLHACWTDTKAFVKPTADGRALASMQDAASFGLDRMPSVEPAVASLIVPPDEALRSDARCPRPQCRATDELLCRAYDAGARMGRIGNSMSHLLLGLTSSLESVGVDSPTQGLLDTALQAFAFMSRELGRLLAVLTQARRQVWLAQSPLTESCRRTLRGLPVVPGELFGSAALEALQRTAQASQTRQQLAGLHRRVSTRVGVPVPPLREQSSGQFTAPRRPVRPDRFRGDRGGPQTPRLPRSGDRGRRPPGSAKDRGGRR